MMELEMNKQQPSVMTSRQGCARQAGSGGGQEPVHTFAEQEDAVIYLVCFMTLVSKGF